ncbi:MAG TPA: type VI secretion system tip protein TssI/VgrG [Gemmatimonadaceae bacterium]|jgi:type VI secretion system secreted protein VgrG
MGVTFTQANRPLTATTPLGDDVLLPIRLVGEEAVSRPFVFTVDFVSTNFTIDSKQLLGKSITLHWDLADTQRPINGIVSRFASLGRDREFAHYRAEIVPELWLLKLWNASRTFEKMAPLDIAEQIVKDDKVTTIDRSVASPPPMLQYSVQYRETDFDYVSRLLEEAGVYYTFTHKDGSHALVFSDAVGATIPAGIATTVNVSSNTIGDSMEADVAYEFEREQSMHTSGFAIQDHDLLRADSIGSANSTSPGAQGTRTEFVGDLGPDTSAAEAKLLIEAEEVSYDMFRGKSNHCALAAGTRVKFQTGPNTTVETHLLRVRHNLTIGDMLAGGGFEITYENEFEAIPAATPFRPDRFTPHPSVRGNQTAKIVGSGSDGDLDVDENGMVLLQFPWDSGAGKDGASNHRVHVASIWAGTGWGFVQHPRIGQEVLVEYLEGDVERPLVTGRVYNSSNKFPYALPADVTQSGWKSRSLNGGDDNFNEIRFEDKGGSEQVFVQAEKDLETKVKNDETRNVLHDRTTTITNADTRTVKEADDTHTIEKGNQVVTVKEGDQTVTIEKGNQTFEVKTGDQKMIVNNDQAINVTKGNRKVEIDMGNDTLKVKMGNQEITVDQGNITIKASLGKITLEAMQGIELKVGQNTVKLDQASISAKGVMVSVEAQAQASMKGAMVQIEGQGITQIKAPMTQVNGDGMVMVKGGIAMIN